ncbi:inner membrane transporter RhtA [Actinocorallia herbida]|uniref:Inner membrane transporter RhtA n=1 Tax=Actinocorallia herbida TaxID=58109 RepID=A0A3N1CYH0_9ACTN|nr:EamA family transporter [Actinocorallia herbida]ROO86334.1 inner membrane transporter RhtA [Actinocorallia herbida]
MTLSAPVRVPRAGSAIGVALMLTSATSLQVGAVVSASLFPRVGAAGTTVLRLTLASLLLLALTRPAVLRWDAHRLRSVALLGVTMAGMNGLFYESISRIPLGTSVTIQFVGPLALAAFLSRRARDLVPVAAAIAGVALLGLQHPPTGPLDPVGVAFAAAAGVFWALYILAGSRMAATGAGAGGVAVAMGVAALVALPFGAVSAGPALLSPGILAFGVVIAVMASAIPYAAEMAALSRLPKKTFSVLLALEPAVAALVGALFLAQPLTPATCAAVLLVLLAATASAAMARPRKASRGDAPEAEPVSPPVRPAADLVKAGA